MIYKGLLLACLLLAACLLLVHFVLLAACCLLILRIFKKHTGYPKISTLPKKAVSVQKRSPRAVLAPGGPKALSEPFWIHQNEYPYKKGDFSSVFLSHPYIVKTVLMQ